MGVILVFCASCQIKELTSAKVHIQQNDWDKAVIDLEKAVMAHPENAEAQFLLGRGYAAQKRFANMHRAFDASLAASTRFELEIKSWRHQFFSEYFDAGVKAARENNLSAARDALVTAVMIDSKQPEAYKRLAEIHAQLGEVEKALTLYQQVVEINPDDWEAHLAVAEIYTQQRDYEQGIVILEQALRKNPQEQKILAALAGVYDCLGKSDDALAAYQQALQIVPENRELLTNVARMYLYKNDYQKALQQYGKVLSLDPDDFEANYNVGLLYLKMGENSQQSSRQSGRQFQAEALQNFKTALPFLLKATTLDTLHAGAYFNLGVGLTRLGETDKAAQAFKRCDRLQEKR
jgi:tetratricopeptide (TPR) repeat protein